MFFRTLILNSYMGKKVIENNYNEFFHNSTNEYIITLGWLGKFK